MRSPCRGERVGSAWGRRSRQLPRRRLTAVGEALREPGRPLPADSRAFLDSRFGYDFSRVAIHTGARAGSSARAVGALAYTLGTHIVLADGAPHVSSPSGRWMLGHEAAHVVQQQPSPGVARASGLIQRTVHVRDPAKHIPNPGGRGVTQTNAETVAGYLTRLCASGAPRVDPASGSVSIAADFCTETPVAPGHYGPPMPSRAQMAATPTGCTCLCDLVHSANRWTIVVDDANWPHTLFDNRDKARGRSPGGTGGSVTTPSPNSPKLWGAATQSGAPLDIDPWLVLGHELCGHAWLGNAGLHAPDETPPRGEGGHQATVARENLLRQEHGIDLRGTFKDPMCGESYWRDRAAPGRVNWSSFLQVCEAWRNRYNAQHGTSYTLRDRIP